MPGGFTPPRQIKKTGGQKQRFWGRIPTGEELMIASDTAEIVSKL